MALPTVRTSNGHEMGGPGFCDSRDLVLAEFPLMERKKALAAVFFAKMPPIRHAAVTMDT